jgi:transposase-like protein
MNKEIINKLNGLIQGLSEERRAYYLEALRKEVNGVSKIEVTECPCCEQTNFMKYGFYKGVQKYKCRNTNQSFSYKTNLIISGLVKLNKMDRLMELMMTIGYLTLDEIQKSVLISRPTALNWRNKILTAIHKVISMSGIIEFDETNLRLSFKGRHGLKYARKRGKKLVGDNDYNVKVFMAYSRTSKKIELYQSHTGRTCPSYNKYYNAANAMREDLFGNKLNFKKINSLNLID